MATTVTARVSHLENCVEHNSELIGAVVDKIDVMMDRQLDDRVILDKHTRILENGLSDRIARAIVDYQRIAAEKLAEEQRKALEEEREERRLQLEEQREANAEMGRRKDRVNRLLIASVPIITVGITLLINMLHGG